MPALRLVLYQPAPDPTDHRPLLSARICAAPGAAAPRRNSVDEAPQKDPAPAGDGEKSAASPGQGPPARLRLRRRFLPEADAPARLEGCRLGYFGGRGSPRSPRARTAGF